MAMDYNQLAVNILEAIGGSQNVENVSHCMTRLRFVMNDNAKVDMKKLQEINGVIRVIDTDTQLQIVIGSAVDKVYKEVCAVGNFESQEPVQQNADADKENKTKKKITPKSVANGIIDAVSGSLVPILPAIIAAGIFKMVAVLLGPTNLGVFTEDNQLYIFCNLVNTAVFYFLPFFIAYTASKKFNATPLYAMMVVAVMIHPDMLDIINAGETFKLYGIFNMQLINYTSSVIPIVLSTWVISYIEKFVKKIVPDHFRVVGVPVLIMVLAVPAALCICGPACNAIMQLLVNVILWMNDTLGIVAIVIVAVFWLFLMMFGMHMPLMMTLLPVWMQMGYDAIVSPGAIASSLAHVGAILSYAIRANNQDKRAFGWTAFITMISANIGEPALYGITLVEKRVLAYQMAGAACGAVVMYILGAKVTLFSGVGFVWLNFLRFGEYAVAGAIGMIVAFVVSFVLGMVLGYGKEIVSSKN